LAPPLLPALGWDDSLAADWAARDRTDHYPARITRVDRSGYDLLADDGPVRATPSASVLAAIAADSTAAPCVGDWVAVRRWPDDRLTVEQVMARRTAVVRARAAGQSQGQVLAANVDIAMVVEPLHPEPDLGRIERLLALAWQSGAPPVVVLTKADLVPDAVHIASDVTDAAPGVDVHAVSATTGAGVDALRTYVRRGRSVAMLGASGAGKSTLTNVLAGVEVMATRELRADGKGRHTTARRELILLPGGGVIIDTPGLRKVGLFAAADGIRLVFDDVEQLDRECRFNDCGHDTEPGCAVQAAIAAGQLHPRRLESWHKLRREMLRMELRQDARLRAAQLARWKALTKAHRSLAARRHSTNW
jgi:ribosome biogenesis GTPase